jgi:hypothetical protein
MGASARLHPETVEPVIEERSARLHPETVEPVIEERGPLPCEHDKPGTWVRHDLIRDYAARGYCCVHGHIADD